MQRVAIVALLVAVLAPLFPVPLSAEDEGFIEPSATSTVPALETSEEETSTGEEAENNGFEPEMRDGASTTPQFQELQGRMRMVPQTFRMESALEGDESALYRQISSYTSNGTVAIGVRSVSSYEYQAGVAYTPDITEEVAAVAFIIGRSGDRTGHIHAEVWHDDERVAISNELDVSEFHTHASINGSQEAFEAGLVTFDFATPVALEAGETYYLVAGAGDDLSAYLDVWVSFAPAPYPVAQQSYSGNFREILYANFILYPASVVPPECTQACGPSVLFLPGIKGSAFVENGETLWPPTVIGDDLLRLKLDADGNSVNDIQVGGVLGDFYGIDVYGGFAAFMDEQVADGILSEWLPMPYDWRLPPEKIISEGVKTPDGTIDVIEAIEELASRSPTGKVTIVGHSMGGIMGKALIRELVARGEEDIVDSFVMVGTPQLGTPQGVASLLHGDGESMGWGFITKGAEVRELGLTMGSAYNLLPSPRYLETIVDPVITFDEDAGFTNAWRARWGTTIDSYVEFEEFLTGTGVPRVDPDSQNLALPEILNSSVLESAEAMHENLDEFVFPESIRVVQVAGWGIPTVKSIDYKVKHLVFQGYETSITSEGDKTVVYPSALSSDVDESYFFDLFAYNDLESTSNFEHANLLNSEPIKDLVSSILQTKPIVETEYILSERPDVSELDVRLLITTRSPVLLGAQDSEGNFTGIDPEQDRTSGVLIVQEDIPGSTFLVEGGDQYLFLPKEGSYTFSFVGTDTGPATVEVHTFSNDKVLPEAIYPEIPVTPATEATFVINAEKPGDTHLAIDSDGDGNIDTILAPEGGTLSIRELLLNLKATVSSLTVQDKHKTQLLKKITAIENKIDKQVRKQSNVLAKLQAQVLKKAGKGKIDATTAASISNLLDELLLQSALVPIEPELLTQLKFEITGANIAETLKASLLAKVARIENTLRISTSLNAMNKTLARKEAKGVLSPAEVQNLLNLLDQVQAAL